ncbi:DUF5302 domain-containing protein [Streptomyces sp. NPDC057445]|uniref:DUF5302 domain-containing protein n=1 Tax=Streptomyces sp. NPDC057445 TaxID=3346136 RepID=UPI0036845615
MTEKPESNAAETEAKRKFREALERKARTARSQQAHHEGRLKIKGSNAPVGQNRNFRRKSG